LVKEAEKIAKKEFSLNKIAVISALELEIIGENWAIN